MSDKYTEVETDHGGIGEWDHVEPQEAIRRLRRYWESQRDEAVATLADIDAGRVRVYHQYGPWARNKRKLVYPQGGDA